MQISHTRHQKTTSNLTRISSKCRLRVCNEQSLERAMYKTFGKKLGGPPKKKRKLTISQNSNISDQNKFTRLFEFLKLYKQQNPLKKFFIFAIYQNYASFSFKVETLLTKAFNQRLPSKAIAVYYEDICRWHLFAGSFIGSDWDPFCPAQINYILNHWFREWHMLSVDNGSCHPEY